MELALISHSRTEELCCGLDVKLLCRGAVSDGEQYPLKFPGFFLSLFRSTVIPSLYNSDVSFRSVWHLGFRFYTAQIGARTKDRLRIVTTLKDVVTCWAVVVRLN